MTFAEFKSRFIGEASWKEPETWPRSAQLLTLVACGLMTGLVAASVIMGPAWSSLRQVRSQRSEVHATFIAQAALLSSADARIRELQQLRRGRIDPMSMDAVNQVFESNKPIVSVSESGDTASIEGEGSFVELEAWLAAVTHAQNLPLRRWKTLRIESHGAELSWNGELQGIEKAADAVTLRADSHAVSLGRNPFLSLAAESETAVASAVPMVTTLPLEDEWPRPSVTDWPVASLRMIGTLGALPQRALLMAGVKSLYVVRAGDVIGRERQVVQRILADRLRAGDTAIRLAPQIMEQVP